MSEGGVPWDQPEADPLADIQAAILKAKNAPATFQPSGWITQEQMAKWLEAKLPEGHYLDWQSGSEPEVKPTPEVTGYLVDTGSSKLVQHIQQQLIGKGAVLPPVDTPLTSTNTEPENPATAPCRVYWNAHRCDKPRIHVLPGHPAGPDHECGWAGLGGYVEPCTRIEADGSQHWYDDATHEWGPLVGEPWPVRGEDWHGAFG